MSDSLSILVFIVAGMKFALPLSAVQRVLPAVEVTPLPGAPHIALGVISVAGDVIPVLGIRRRLSLPETEGIQLSDQFILIQMTCRRVALVVEAVEGVVLCDFDQITSPETVLTTVKHVKGILQMSEGLILVQDLEAFLNLEETKALEAAIRSEQSEL